MSGRSCSVDLGIDVAIDLDDVRPSVIVVVDKPAAPCYITVVDAHPGSKGHIAEGSIAIVVVQVAGVIRKVGLEDIEPSVTVIVGHAQRPSPPARARCRCKRNLP